jgi:hypothetical protein
MLQIAASLADDSRGVIYNCTIYTKQATVRRKYSETLLVRNDISPTVGLMTPPRGSLVRLRINP